MIHKITMYGATCDNCIDTWIDDHHGWYAMNDEESLNQVLYENGWHVDGDNHYCPKCYTIDDEDNLILKEVIK